MHYTNKKGGYLIAEFQWHVTILKFHLMSYLWLYFVNNSIYIDVSIYVAIRKIFLATKNTNYNYDDFVRIWKELFPVDEVALASQNEENTNSDCHSDLNVIERVVVNLSSIGDIWHFKVGRPTS